MKIHLAIMAICLIAALGCKRSYGRQSCRMENEMVVAKTSRAARALNVKSIAPDRFVIAWSSEDGTWTAVVDDDGKTKGPIKRIGRSKIQWAVDEKKGFWSQSEQSSIVSTDLCWVKTKSKTALVMLEQNSSIAGGIWISVPEADISSLMLSAVGQTPKGLSAVSMGDDILIAWHEGGAVAPLVRLIAIDSQSFKKKKEATFQGVAAPALAVDGSMAMMVWNRAIQHGTAMAIEAGQVSFAKPNPVAQLDVSRHSDPSPDIISLDGSFGVVYRDDKDEDETGEFYFLNIDHTGNPISKPARISQADGYDGPRIVANDQMVVSGAIRSYQRNYLVGLNRFDKKGVKLCGEFQVYADKSNFVRVDISGANNQLLMVYVEDTGEGGKILAGKIRCS